MFRMPGQSHAGPLPPLTSEQRERRERLHAHVHRLAGEIGERHVWEHESLAATAVAIEQELRCGGFEVRSQWFEAEGHRVRNLEVERPGNRRDAGIVLVGAHYDSVVGSPGANDNASGVAALIELARSFAGRRPERTVRFVAFVNEEAPFFRTRRMGSLVYARRSRAAGERMAAMLSLETIGCYTNARGSQQYPFPVGLFYPDRGDFIGFVGNFRSRALVREMVGSFRRHTAFPSQGAAVPGWLEGVGWSDHWAFWRQGYPAAMVTDTAFFRYPHYHLPSDTPDRLDYEGLSRVVSGLEGVVDDLANPATQHTAPA